MYLICTENVNMQIICISKNQVNYDKRKMHGNNQKKIRRG